MSSSCTQFVQCFQYGNFQKPFLYNWPKFCLTSWLENLDAVYGEMKRKLDIFGIEASIQHVKAIKSKNQEILKVVKNLCGKIVASQSPRVPSILKHALLSAAKSGIHEIVEEILEAYPDAILFADSENHNIFHLAVIHRHEKVFNLIYQLTDYKHLVTSFQDVSGNNILHLVAKLAPPHSLSLVSGAALQMQRELQWFQEVEKFVHPTLKLDKNSEGKTPAMVFTEEHRHLVKEGEKWMKHTANSCTFVAALMATVGFAAAITVPGGNNQTNGVPIFYNEKAFLVFSVSDACSLFSSVASVLMFLSILTSRYTGADFLLALPKRLILGLLALFFSITSLMTAFGAAIYLVFGRQVAWILAPVILAAFVPITMFWFLQFPLLVDMILSTYGPSIFGKQRTTALY